MLACALCGRPLAADTRVFARHSRIAGIRRGRLLRVLVFVRLAHVDARPSYLTLAREHHCGVTL